MATPLLRLRKALGRIRRRFVVDHYDVFLREVPEELRLVVPTGYEFRWGTAEEILACDPVHTELDERERALGARRIELGHRVVLGLRDGLVVFTMWANPRNLNVPGLLKRALGPGQWFIYKAYTSPEHRGRKLYETGMRFVLAEMRAESLRELVGYAHVKKSVSRKGLAALQFRSAGTATLVDFPGFRRVLVSRELARSFPRVVPRSGVLAADPSGLRSTTPA